jgi:hypothetical protein
MSSFRSSCGGGPSGVLVRVDHPAVHVMDQPVQLPQASARRWTSPNSRANTPYRRQRSKGLATVFQEP